MTFFVTSPHSASLTKAATRSVAALFGSAPACWGLISLPLNALHVILRATSLSNPFPKHEISAIGLYDLQLLRSFLPGLGIITTSASFQALG